LFLVYYFIIYKYGNINFKIEGKKFGLSVKYIDEEKPLGTAGPLSLMRNYFSKDEDFVLMNGDIFTQLNFSKMIDHHKNAGYRMTIGYRTYEHKLPFGVLEIENAKLCGIVEKPSTNFNVSAGIYVLNSSIIDFIPDNAFFTIPDLATKLLEKKHSVGTYHIQEYWLGIENIGHFNEAIKELNRLESFLKNETSAK